MFLLYICATFRNADFNALLGFYIYLKEIFLLLLSYSFKHFALLFTLRSL